MAVGRENVSVIDLFAAPPGADGEAEVFETLLERPGWRLERIVSSGQSTPDGEWYDQETEEWVVLLSGAARLSFADSAEPLVLSPGQAVSIPAHCRHRVEWTDPDIASVWLALHFTAEV